MGFAVGRYEPTRPLVIDPVLAFSTYWGGDRDEEGQDLAVDAAGRAYVTGMTFSDDFPITADAFQPTYNYLWAVFVAVLSADGSSLLFSSYLGGGHWDASTGIVLDAAGRYAYVTGFTRSGDFPTKDPVQPSHDGTRGDAFVAKISTNLSADLIVSALAAPSTARAGTGITVTDTTKNRGEAARGPRPRPSTCPPIRPWMRRMSSWAAAPFPPGARGH